MHVAVAALLAQLVGKVVLARTGTAVQSWGVGMGAGQASVTTHAGARFWSVQVAVAVAEATAEPEVVSAAGQQQV